MPTNTGLRPGHFWLVRAVLGGSGSVRVLLSFQEAVVPCRPYSYQGSSHQMFMANGLTKSEAA